MREPPGVVEAGHEDVSGLFLVRRSLASRSRQAITSTALAEALAVLLRVHLACAFRATALFWTAATVTKGGRLHRSAGRWFSRLIYAAAWTGGVMAVASLIGSYAAASSSDAIRTTRQTMWLVLYILVIIVAPVQHGLA